MSEYVHVCRRSDMPNGRTNEEWRAEAQRLADALAVIIARTEPKAGSSARSRLNQIRRVADLALVKWDAKKGVPG